MSAWARTDLRRGELFRGADGHFFEHFYKERCLIHPRMFPYYRQRLMESSWWGTAERERRLIAAGGESLIAEVLAEVAACGPVTAGALTGRGAVAPMDWSGWSGTGSRTKMALEVLWSRCEVVIAARDAKGQKVYDVPARALPGHAGVRPEAPFAEAVLLERVASAGMLPVRAGPWWSALQAHRTDGTIARLVEQGAIQQIAVGTRRYLALPDLLSRADPLPDAASGAPMRLLAPLDALLWDRELVRALWGFDYVWEIYKPEAQRRWGYYVCPLLDGEDIVGRVECLREKEGLRLLKRWEERPGSVDPARLRACLEDLAWRNGGYLLP